MSDTLQTELHIDVARKLLDNPEWIPTRLMWSRLLAVAERAQTEAREAATALSEVSRERDEARGDLSGAFQQNAYAAVHALARAEHADAEAASLHEELAKAMEAQSKLLRLATDRAYMLEAYRNMLGPKGMEVAAIWADGGVQRIHFDWGPEADKMSGEERAQYILEWEKAPRSKVTPEEIDAPDAALNGSGA